MEEATLNIVQLQERRHVLIKGRDQLVANINITNGAIAELDRLIDLLIRANEEGAKVCQDTEAKKDTMENLVEKPPETKRRAAKRVEKESEVIGGDKEN